MADTDKAPTANERLRLCEDLIRSKAKTDIENGLKLAEELAGDSNLSSDRSSQAIYLCAFAQYKLSRYVEARRQLTELLKVDPHHTKAQELKVMVEDQLVKEGLIGVGIGAGLLGLIGVAIAAAFGARR